MNTCILIFFKSLLVWEYSMQGSLLISVTPFSQACEHDVLLSVVKWGEAQVLQNMADQGTKSFN